MKMAFFIAVASICVSCATLTDIRSNNVNLNNIYKDYRARDDRTVALIGGISIENKTNNTICVRDDVFVNDLSPFVEIQRLEKSGQRSRGLPYPPLSRDIARIETESSRQFERIIDIVEPGRTRRSYKIAIQLWNCDSSEEFSVSTQIDF